MAVFLFATGSEGAQPQIRKEAPGFWNGRLEFRYGTRKVAVESLSKIERFRDKGFQITKVLRHLNGLEKGF